VRKAGGRGECGEEGRRDKDREVRGLPPTGARTQDWERARQKQNEKLDLIALGLDKLNDLGTAIGEELERQDAFVQSLEERVDKVRLKLNKNTENIGTASTKVSMGIKLGTVSVLLFVFLILLGAFLVHLT